MIDKTIFREYDIRGIVGKDLTDDLIYLIARAFGSIVARDGAETICTNYDGREASPRYAEILNKGLAECGLRVIDLGLGSTPMNYFGIRELNADAGMMITASHNPKEYDGVKMTLQDGVPFCGEMIQSLIPLIESKDFVDGKGAIEKKDINDYYIKRLLLDLELDKNLKIVWDNGNGAGGEILQELVKKIPGEHTVLYGEVDGAFPNHHPNPSEYENLKDLQEKVLELGADVGLAFDGDADRVGVVTNKGEIIGNDILLAMFAKQELEKYPGDVVIGDVKCSRVLFDKIKEFGGEPLIWKTGNVHIKAKLQEMNGLLGGEVSGHMFFNKGFYGHDDGMYAAIKMLDIINASDKTLSEMLAEYPKTEITKEVLWIVSEEDKFSIVEQVTKAMKSKSDFDILDIDGVRATNEDGFILVRASNTQNALTLRCESGTKDGLLRLVDILIAELTKAGVKIATEDLV